MSAPKFPGLNGLMGKESLKSLPRSHQSRLKMIIDRSIILNEMIMSVGDSSCHQQSYSGLYLHVQLYSVYLEDQSSTTNFTSLI